MSSLGIMIAAKEEPAECFFKQKMRTTTNLQTIPRNTT